jgi:23S rRNA (guanosine2251-2'-O)-methyltransferase
MRDNFQHRNNRNNDNDASMIYGTRAIIEAIKSGKELERLFVQAGLNNPLMRELKTELKAADIMYQQVPIEKLNRLTRQNHQGVVGYISEVEYSRVEEIVPGIFESGKTPLILILDRITDTRNLGAIARTAECSGVNAIVIPSRGSALINADTVKTSAGALHHLPVCREDNLKATIDYLRDSGFYIVACSEKTDKYVFDIDLKKPLAIIMGSEENGVSPEYMKKCDAIAKIPMSGHIESYNVSVAAGMILFETMRQRFVK